MTKIFLPISVLILMLLSCSNENTVSILTQEGKTYSFSEFIGGITNFPYEAPINQRGKVISGFHKLKLGVNKKITIELLGEPDAEFFSYDMTKEKLFKDSFFAYYLKRHEANLANDKFDEVVFLHFDKNNKLYWSQSVNLEGLIEIGGLSKYR